jgi:hypothetical protein
MRRKAMKMKPKECRCLESGWTDIPAPRPDGQNLKIVIKVGSTKATFNCQALEHVGNHKSRFVTFLADASCKLCFGNAAVFGTSSAPLSKNRPKNLNVSDQTNNVDTNYCVERTTRKTVKRGGIVKKPPSPMNDPKIVVP